MPTDYKIISKIQAPDGSIYEIKPSENANINTDGIYYVSATGTASALTGTINDLDAYYNGLKIVLYNGSGVDTNAACTLKINDLAAVSIKKNGTTNLGTIYDKTIAVLCYVDGVFYHNNYYDSNTTEDSFTVRYLATDTANVLQYSLCALTDNDKISSFTTNTSASTNTGKSVTTLAFRMGFPIFYRAGSTISANTTTTSYYTLYENKKSVDIRYSMCYYSASRISATGPTYLYMNVEVGNGTYTPKKQATSVSNAQDHIVCKGLTINELIDGNFYIYLGVCSSTSAKYTMDFAQDNPLYYYDGTNDILIEYDTWKNNLQDSSISDIEYTIFEMESTMESLQDQIITNFNAIQKLGKVNIRDCSINAYTPLNQNSLCMLDTSGNLTGLVTTCTTSTGKTLSTDVTDVSIAFRLGAKVFVAGKAYDAGATVEDLSTLCPTGPFDARYSSVYPSTSGGLPYGTTEKSMIFMPISINFDTNTFTLKKIVPNGASSSSYSTNLITIDRLVYGYYYVFIGYRRKYNGVSSDTYIVDLAEVNTVYYYSSTTGLVPYEMYRDFLIGNQIEANEYEHSVSAHTGMTTKYDISTGALCMFSKDMELCTFSQFQTSFNLIPNTVRFDMDTIIYVYDSNDRTANSNVDRRKLLQATKDFTVLFTANVTNIQQVRAVTRLLSGVCNIYMPIDLDESDGSFSLSTVEATNGTNTYTVNMVSDNSESDYVFPAGFYKLICRMAGETTAHGQLPLENPVYYYDGTDFIPYNAWKNNQQDTSISNVSTLLQDVSTHVSILDASVDYIYDTSLTFLNMNTIKDSSIAVGAYPLNKDSLCMVATDGKLYPFVTQATTANTTSSGSGAYNTIPDTIKFRIGTDVFIAGKTYSANTLAVDVSSLYMSKEVDIRYSTRYISTSGSGYAIDSSNSRNRVFLCINVDNEHGEFTISKTYLSSGGWMLPIVAESQFTSLCAEKFYMFLGYASKRSDYKSVWISPKHPIYYYDGTSFIEYNAYMHYMHDQLLDDIDQHLSIIDTSITHLETASGDNDWLVIAPIAGQDIYASEDYPAIVCLEYNYNYDAYNPSEYTSHYLMYDITYIGSGRHLDLDWGYAVLTHDVSAGQRVDRKYLHRKWTYTLHTDLEDEHKQGFDIDSFLALNNGNPPEVDYICGKEVHGQNLIDVRSGTIGSLYRVIDSSIQSFIHGIGLNTMYDKSDGPDLYIVLRYGISSSSTGIINDYMYMEPGLCCVAVPRPRFYDYNTHTNNNPFYMTFSDNFWTGQPIYLSDYWGPVFYNFGKVNFNQINGTVTSISIDFSRNLFQAYDVSGNQRSIPGYGFSSGVSIFEGPISGGGSSGGTGFANVYGSWSYLTSDVTCPANTDTSVLSIDIPYAGIWKIDAQATLENTVSDHMGVDCYLLNSTTEYVRITAATVVNVPLKVPSGLKPINAGANVYLSELINVGSTGHTVSLALRPGDCSITAKAIHGHDDTNTTYEGMGTATHIIITRLSDDVPV